MQSTFFLLLLIGLCLLAGVVIFVSFQLAAAVREFRKFCGKMRVTCPETRRSAAVEVAAGRATLAALFGRAHLELKDCSRWPERADCPQGCLCEIEAGPEQHRAWTIASQWFAAQKCAYCHQPIGNISHLDRPPALLGADLKTTEWKDIPAQYLPDFFSLLRAVCWNCHIAETFRREHPDLVTDRNWRVPARTPASKAN